MDAFAPLRSLRARNGWTLWLALLATSFLACAGTPQPTSDAPLPEPVEGRGASEYAWPVDTIDDITLALWNVADRAAPTPQDQPFLVAHQLLACGRGCERPDGEPVLERWLDGGLDGQSLGYFHPGQLLALLYDLDVGLERTIRFQAASAIAVGELLADERDRFAMPPRDPTPSEQRRGAEYGWLLRAFCGYLGPEAQINEQWSVLDVLEQLVDDGLPPSSEAQTHELEGMAACVESHRRADHRSERAEQVYGRVEQALIVRLERDLQAMDATGQIYADRTDFDTCTDESGVCNRLGALTRQAHFLEWAVRVAPLSPEVSFAQPVEHFLELAAELTVDLDSEFTGDDFRRHALVISTAGHARHVARTLSRLTR
jgi:hypothetical protein